MAFRIKFLLTLLLLIPFSSGLVQGLEEGMNPTHSLHKDVRPMEMRKLLKMVDAVLDYDDAGANPKHDPKRKPRNG